MDRLLLRFQRTAVQYLKIGYHIGIGGSMIQLEERAKDWREAIPHIPLVGF